MNGGVICRTCMRAARCDAICQQTRDSVPDEFYRTGFASRLAFFVHTRTVDIHLSDGDSYTRSSQRCLCVRYIIHTQDYMHSHFNSI